MNHGESGKNDLDQTIQNLLKEMQILESAILQKSETINIVTLSLNSYHDAISTHINEVYLFLLLTKTKIVSVIMFIL